MVESGNGRYDRQRTPELAKGMVVQPRPTWSYPSESADWQKTLVLLTGPLIVGSVMVEWILTDRFDTGETSFRILPTQNILVAIWTAVLTGIPCSLAQVFVGEGDFARGLAAVSRATVPGWISSGGEPVPPPVIAYPGQNGFDCLHLDGQRLFKKAMGA